MQVFNGVLDRHYTVGYEGRVKEMFEWSLRDAKIVNHMTGGLAFEQKGVEFPTTFSDRAVNVISEKYFYGQRDTPERETSFWQLCCRVVDKILSYDKSYMLGGSYDVLRDELLFMLCDQRFAWNSPVWFNIGTPGEQRSSACFINEVNDNIKSLCQLQTEEAQIFKWGSGAGVSMSAVRERNAKLAGGGTASGPVSFMRGFDAFAGVVKSGGKKRRAAKMIVLDADHPDIYEFTLCKSVEDKKARALIDAGYSSDFTDENGAYASVFFQNANHSVRVDDKFMEAVVNGAPYDLISRLDGKVTDQIDARDLLDTISKTTWECGDPGLQYDGEIQRMHGCCADGRITASNPCVTGDTLVATSDGLVAIESLVGRPSMVAGLDGKFHAIAPAFVTGEKPVYALTTKCGYSLNATGDHKVFTLNRGDVPLVELTKDDQLLLQGAGFGEFAIESQDFAELIGFAIGDGCVGQDGTLSISMSTEEKALALKWANSINEFERTINDGRSAREVVPIDVATGIQVRTSSKEIVNACNEWAVLDEKSLGKLFTAKALSANKETTAALLRGLFTADGTVANYGSKSQYVALDSTALPLLQQVQLMLLSFGIKSKLYKDRRPLGQTTAMLPDGQGGTKEYPVHQMHSLRISRSSRLVFEREIGFVSGNIKNEALTQLNANVSAYPELMVDTVKGIEPLGVQTVYDLTEPDTHHFVGNGLTIHNCSEYLFLNNTACNLASTNLLKYLSEDGVFDHKLFRRDCILIFLTQDYLLDFSEYPTEDIAKKTKEYRTVGLGFTNLGAMLMCMGIPYYSHAAEVMINLLSHTMTAAAYAASADLAEVLGPFPAFDHSNKVGMTDLIKRHYDLFRHGMCYARQPDMDTEHIKYWQLKDDAPDALPDRVRSFIDTCISSIEADWQRALDGVSDYGLRNAQATVLAPTGCVVAETMLLTSAGLLPIDELGDVDGEQWQHLDVQVSQESGTQPATKFYVNGEDRTFQLVTTRGHEIQATWKHQLRVINEAGEYVWRRMEDICPGDIVVRNIGGHEDVLGSAPLVKFVRVDDPAHSNEKDIYIPDHLDERFAALLGYYVGDGYLKEKGGLHMVINEQDTDLVGLFGSTLDRGAAIEERQGCVIAHYNSRRLYRWMKANDLDKSVGNHGEGAASARIPTQVLRSNSRVLGAFLAGLFEADGTVHLQRNNSPTVSLSTTSSQLAKQVSAALMALGIRTTIGVTPPRVDSFGDRPKYRVSCASFGDVKVFASKVGFLSTRKRAVLSQGLGADMACEWRGHTLRSQALIDDLYESSVGLPNDVRQNIAARKTQGSVNVGWLRDVIGQHPQLKSSKIGQLLELGNLEFVEVQSNDCIGLRPTYDLSVPTRNTYVADGFVSHNTISFIMDCDTTGIEPELSLIKSKTLVGGGKISIINQAVPRALKALGYDQFVIDHAVEHILEHGNLKSFVYDGIYGDDVKGTGIRSADLPVFDVSFGADALPWQAHVNAMAAAQPAISGAISKTVNAPEDITPEEIFDIYIDAWRKGLKAVAIYRDNSKGSQPLTASNGTSEDDAQAQAQASIDQLQSIAAVSNGVRRRLSDERDSKTHKFSIGGHEGYITVGLYPDGSPGEVFITSSKQGSTINGLLDAAATLISICLQYGVPLQVIVDKFKHTKYEPSGYTSNPDVRFASSLMDYVVRWMDLRFGQLAESTGAVDQNEPTPAPKPIYLTEAKRTDEYLGALCLSCGGQLVQSGACQVCTQCGSTTGCG